MKRYIVFIAISLLQTSCSPQDVLSFFSSEKRVEISDDGTATGTPQKRLDLKSTPGYKKNYVYTIVGSVYKDNTLGKNCVVSKSDYCGTLLGYRYCTVYPGEIPSPETLDSTILPEPFSETKSKFFVDMCKDDITSPTLKNHFSLMSLFNPNLYKRIVLKSSSQISNASALESGARGSEYYTNASCYQKTNSAFIADADWLSGLSQYRYYDGNGRTIYEIETETTTYYELRGYDCIPVRGHKLEPTSRIMLGYGHSDVSALMKQRENYCKLMCKSYDEEGESRGWAKEIDPNVTPVSFEGISSTPNLNAATEPAPADRLNRRAQRPVAAPVVPAETPAAPAVPAPASAAPAVPAVAIPQLVPEPAVAVSPEDRLTFVKSKTKKGEAEYLIFKDSLLNTPCYVALHKHNIQAQNDNRYCTPFSGNIKDLTHPLALTATAKQYESYTYCSTGVTLEKRNILGLAGYFKAFNPTYYASDLARFADDPIEVRKPIVNTKVKYEGEYEDCNLKFYSQRPGCAPPDDDTPPPESCLLNYRFISEGLYKLYALAPNKVFLTASAKEGEKVLHQYWQVLDGAAETVTRTGYCCCSDDGIIDERIVQVRALNNQTTYEALMPQILAGLPAREQYCKAVNNAFINEARTGNWARLDNDSPLLSKK